MFLQRWGCYSAELSSPYVLGFYGTQRSIAGFMADLGKLLLMFFAGLEIDLALFRRARDRSITFGIATTALPLLLGSRPHVRLRHKSCGFAPPLRAVDAIVFTGDGSHLRARHPLLERFPAMYKADCG